MGDLVICFTVTIFLIMTCYQLYATFSGSKWCLTVNQQTNEYCFQKHHFVLYVLNGEATLWHKLHKLYSLLTVNQQTNKYCFQKQQQPNHAWWSLWLFYALQHISGRQQWGQFGVAVFYSRANHIHSVWVRCPGMMRPHVFLAMVWGIRW
jgi:hypothetical protein